MSEPAPRSTFTLARWAFARLMGVIFFCAFASLGWQIRGLAGARGISPAGTWLDAVWNHLGASAIWQVPTLCWFGASDAMLVTLCLLGVALSLLLIWGECLPGLCTLLLWLLYLSLCRVTNPFLGFQWDALLLETALLAALWLPWSWRPAWARITPRVHVGRWLLWWLLFRLMFESGVVKLASEDAAWESFTALNFHFETQPLPLWTAWIAHQLPHWLLWMSTAIMFLIEFVAPALIVAPRAWRHAAAGALIALQVLIAVTGNYAFFNYLTMALCLTLFDDTACPVRWRGWLPSLKGGPPPRPQASWAPKTAWSILSGVMAVVFMVTVLPLLGALGLIRGRPNEVLPSLLEKWLAPTMSFNGYGLFAVMTTERREIVVEGSNDGLLWKTYEFPWKPGDLNRRPALVAPHQPRLDWQMWFAALGTLENNPWFVQFLARVMEGSPEVLGLLEVNPFPDRPPTYVRASFYRYHFTRLGESGWWKREPLGLYCPPIMLQDGRPVLVERK